MEITLAGYSDPAWANSIGSIIDAMYVSTRTRVLSERGCYVWIQTFRYAYSTIAW